MEEQCSEEVALRIHSFFRSISGAIAKISVHVHFKTFGEFHVFYLKKKIIVQARLVLPSSRQVLSIYINFADILLLILLMNMELSSIYVNENFLSYIHVFLCFCLQIKFITTVV